MHFKILEIHLEKKSGKIFETGPEPEPDIEAGYPAGTGFSRISGRFLVPAEECGNESRKGTKLPTGNCSLLKNAT